MGKENNSQKSGVKDMTKLGCFLEASGCIKFLIFMSKDTCLSLPKTETFSSRSHK